MKNLNALLVFLCLAKIVFGQQVFTIEGQIPWDSEAPTALRGGIFMAPTPHLPHLSIRTDALPPGELRVEWESATGERTALEAPTLSDDVSYVKEQFGLQAELAIERRQAFGHILLFPYRKVAGGGYERLTDFRLRVTAFPSPIGTAWRNEEHTLLSVLADGEVYKMAVAGRGVHKLDYAFLKNSLGVDVDNIDPRRLGIFGNGGGPLPESNSAERPDDLIENAIYISGENDGRFDPQDYILFFAEGPSTWTYDAGSQRFVHTQNVYDTRNYYFLKVKNAEGRRIDQAPNLSGGETVTDFLDFVRHETEEYNLLNDFVYATGSGQMWFGDKFDALRDKTYQLRLPGRSAGQNLLIEAGLAGRHSSSSQFRISLPGGQSFDSPLIAFVNTNSTEAIYARYVLASGNLPDLLGDEISLTLRYLTPGAVGWLDFIQITARRALRFSGPQLAFRHINAGEGLARFELADATANVRIWDVSDPLAPQRHIAELGGATLRFSANVAGRAEFVAFDEAGSLPVPEAIGPLPQQNLHGISALDMLIVTHESLLPEAERLAEFRRQHNGYTVRVVTAAQIYNEFASGKTDPTAIRDFVRMLYQRSEDFRYLLLFGDASFDFRDIYGNAASMNLVPSYQTRESLAPIEAFPSDDYFALLDANEGGSIGAGALDLAVGRLPVSSLAEAADCVNKIIGYESDANSLGDWRNNVTFIGDDNDSSQDPAPHARDANDIADLTAQWQRSLNINKVFFDAFVEESGPGGGSYPAATQAITNAVLRGQLVMCYLGHGGYNGWAQERVLRIADINSWDNAPRLPLFITATCSFAAFEDPTRLSAGELLLRKANGGAIALFTTVRAVYTSSNAALTENTFRSMFLLGESQVGDILRVAKNLQSTGTNGRKYLLLGDPAMRLGKPRYQVRTAQINGVDVQALPDTLQWKALQKVTVSGHIVDEGGQVMSDFNGRLFPSVYDKAILRRTLGNGNFNQPFDFRLQSSILFKGAATVENGAFSFSFVVPKDIVYQQGLGKISYYASDLMDKDAAGNFERINIFGTDENALSDQQGPDVRVFMNDEQFAFGGITDANPFIYVELADDNGINTSSNSLGHELVGILNEAEQNPLTMNDFYEAALDDYTQGSIRYPLRDLAEGRYTVRVRAWDIANNLGEGYTEFVVANSAEAALERVLNYPNPFSTRTEFQFEHNLAGQFLDVEVQIFSIGGRLVKSINTQVLSEGYRVSGIAWDGHDDFGDPLARGVYIYRIRLRGADGQGQYISADSAFEKLVLLR